MAVAHVRSDTLTGLPYTTMPDATRSVVGGASGGHYLQGPDARRAATCPKGLPAALRP